ncbi:hypothetical protein SLEP1_g34183 [Rubroshorea leprosula]|uniref:BZIP domain-containing protein n=2 Tax=Rubroshorea leprosula TaxID=152421 RepID=A0AAV5KJ81_9ROSI|nr:hypothetical protein SLEP1_g34183 [Rubroshorea leprosula]
MGSPSYPNLQPSCDSMGMSFNLSQTIESLLIPTRGTQFNGQQHGHPLEQVGEGVHNQLSSNLTEDEDSVSRTGTPKTFADKAARKKEIDRAYRARQKQKTMDTDREMRTLKDENSNLKNENQSLKLENAYMIQNLQSKETEIFQLKSNLLELKCDHEKQNALVQILSDRLACSDLQHENTMLRYQNAQLRQNPSLDCRIIQLVNENGRLELENRKLRVQNDALCGKIIKDNDKKHMLENSQQ